MSTSTATQMRKWTGACGRGCPWSGGAISTRLSADPFVAYRLALLKMTALLRIAVFAVRYASSLFRPKPSH
tara:strand:+ start:4571 stop:4783 length:213 start_codon:yes stop_codon:yes gene_type:complete